MDRLQKIRSVSYHTKNYEGTTTRGLDLLIVG